MNGWDIKETEETKWPTVTIGDGNSIMGMIDGCTQTPEWVIVDGGALHGNTTRAMAARRLKLWGMYGSVSVWTVKLNRDHLPTRYGSVHHLATK